MASKMLKLEIPSSFYPRLKRLQDVYREKVQSCQQSVPTWAYEALLGPMANPLILLCNTRSNAYCDFFPEKLLTVESDEDKAKSVIGEVKYSSAPHMYVVALNVTRRGPHIEIEKQSLDFLKQIKVSISKADYPPYPVVYLVNVIEDSAAKGCQTLHQELANLVKNAFDDNDKHLASRIFFKGEKGMKERCSRILEKSFCDSFVNINSSLKQDAQNHLNKTTVFWNCDLFTREAMTIFSEREDELNETIQNIMKDNHDGKISTISKAIATVVKDEICCAIEQSLGTHLDFQNFNSDKPGESCCFIDMIKHKLWFKKSRGETIALSEILDSSSMPLVEEYIRKQGQNLRRTDQYQHLIKELDSLSEVIQEQKMCMREDIPYELQIYLWRLKHVISVKKRDKTLHIGVSRAEFSNNQSFLKNAIRALLRDWKEFEENDFILQPFAKTINFLMEFGSGGTVGHYVNGVFRRGVAGVIGDMAGIVQFAITCCHVAPPGYTIYNDKEEAIGKSFNNLCIKTEDEHSVGLLDFSAVPMNELISVKQDLRPPRVLDVNFSVELFDKDFSVLQKQNIDLYFHRKGEHEPVIVKYMGETYIQYNDDSDEFNSGPVKNNENRFPFRRLDVVIPSNSNRKICPGDSGSALCYFDQEENAVQVVFLIVGENDEGIVCCRLNEALMCLKNRADYHISLLPV
ncbi:uncharacterized protein LOC134274430 [Saccostrea cucullata]|uniref:uncharacterized protein LOC134274430 n=1 Tax=Saccostrea cuccullata TaxID=36930 RepID=UPI002ED38D75